MDLQLKGAGFLTRFIARDQRGAIEDIRTQLRYLGETVDSFYDVLGPRNWVFHDRLNVEHIARLVKLPVDDAEAAFIAIHTDTDDDNLARWVRGLRSYPDMVPRLNMIEAALRDYREARFYSTVLLLTAAMDGFVNDLDKGARKGLHARDISEMRAWDSVVGHHMGLTRVMKSFQTKVTATSSEPVYELHRHGIMHGVLTNFDNVVVATKAWNYMFAVVDWADSRNKSLEPAKSKPSLRELVGQIQATEKTKTAVEAWSPSILTPSDQGWDGDLLVQAVRSFFVDWMERKYGKFASTLQVKTEKRIGKSAPGVMRSLFQDFSLDAFELVEIEFTAPAIAVVRADLIIAGKPKRSESRWVFESADGRPSVNGFQNGSWARVFDGPEGFISG
jgi:hypothetical protein